jgi:hypothetical protein
MNYVAWLPAETVAATLDANLFQIEANRTILRRMLGIEAYKPTDCVGTVSEARLAFAMCRAKGVGGPIADGIEVDEMIAEAPVTIARYGAVAAPGRPFPRRLVEPIGGQLTAAGEDARQRAAAILSHAGQLPSS